MHLGEEMKIGLAVTLFLLALSANLFAAGTPVCLLESDAQLYGCIENKSSQDRSFCQDEFGADYLAYYVSDACRFDLATELSGISYKQKPQEKLSVACLRYELANKNNCTLLEYEQAYRFCGQLYGDRYLPFVESAACSVELADSAYGFVPSENLVSDFKAEFEEVETIMTMLDRQGYRDSLMSMVSLRPVIGNEFYTPVMKGLLSKLKVLSAQLEKRSQYKIKYVAGDKHIADFLSYINRYQQLVARVHKVYAYVAHRNHNALDKYKFANLNFLNLRLHRVFALEILSQVNYKVRTVDENLIEFVQSKQDLQMHEYMALSGPESKEDYGKLIKFLGVRENLINLWAIDRMSQQDILGANTKSCGGFLSLENKADLSKLSLVKENQSYELFYHGYLKIIPKLAQVTHLHALLQDADTIFLKQLIASNKGLAALIQSYVQDTSEQAITAHASEDISILKQAELEDWLSYAEHKLPTLVLPGDDLFDKDAIAQRIVDASFARRLKSLSESFLGMYPFLQDSEQEQISSAFVKYFSAKKGQYGRTLKRKLLQELRGYGRIKQYAQKNLENKVEETVNNAQKYMHYANAAVKLTSRKSAELKPASIEELMWYFESKIAKSYQDLKLTLDHNQTLAKKLSTFFSEVAKKFNEKFLRQVGANKMQLQGTAQERSQYLWQVLLETANGIYTENGFDLAGLAAVPMEVQLARSHDELARSPYTLDIYKDGTPVTVSLDELYLSFQEKLKVEIPHQYKPSRSQYLMGIRPLFELEGRQHSDAITDGTFGRPRSYLTPQGEITYHNVEASINHNALARLYHQSLNLTKFEIAQNTKVKEEVRRKNAIQRKEAQEESQVITDPQKMFARVFELFHLPLMDIKTNKSGGSFSLAIEDEKLLVANQLSKVYAASPLLKIRIKLNREVDKWVRMRSRGSVFAKVRKFDDKQRSLIQQMALYAYDEETKEFNKLKASELVEEAIERARVSVQGNINDFCGADYKDYKNDDSFKNAFKAASFLRTGLKTDMSITPLQRKELKEFDHEIAKEIRTPLEALNEDYVEPNLMIAGAIFLGAIAVFVATASFGTAVPPMLGAAASLAGTMLSSLSVNLVFLGMAGISTATRINSQLIEIPAQLKFQQSIANSQIVSSDLADYAMIDKRKEGNTMEAMITIGLAPLDIWFGHSVAMQVRSTIGLSGVKNFEKLTGVKINKYSAPPRSLRFNTKYQQLRAEYGNIGGLYQMARNASRNGLAHLPRYQMLPQEMLTSIPLRIGLARKFKEMNKHNTPWFILDDVKTYVDKFQGRFSSYNKYLEDEQKVVRELILNDGLNMGEVFKNGLGKTRFIYWMRSEIKAIKEGRFSELRRRHGDLIDEIKHMQASLLKEKYEMLGALVKKIENFKELRLNKIDDNELTNDFLRLFSDEELVLLGEIVKKSKGKIRAFKPVFKQYAQMLESLKPMSYLYGQPGVEFAESNGRSMTFLDDEIDKSYVFKSDTEDIVNFYEESMRLNGLSHEKNGQLREKIEEEVSKLFVLDPSGTRLYL